MNIYKRRKQTNGNRQVNYWTKLYTTETKR